MSVSEESISFDKPLVSVIIGNYNYEKFIAKAINSALNQTYPNIEVIVVDDGSLDSSPEIITNYKERIISVLKENGGQASTFNAGFAASQGDIICFLDSDDIFLSEKIAEIVEVFEFNKDLGWCFHNLKWIDENTNPLPKSSTQRSSQECDFRELLKRGKIPPPLPATSALCFRRSLLQQILPMPTAKSVPASEHYLKFTAVALSKGFFLDKVLAFHRIHGNNAGTLRKDRKQARAMNFIFAGCWVRNEFPFLAKFANKLFALGTALYWQTESVEAENKEVIKNYLSSISLLERFKINFIAIYYYFKERQTS